MENDKMTERYGAEEETIDLQEMFFLLKRHIVVIALTAVLFAVAGFAGTLLFITPQYQATATMIVNTRQDQNATVTNDQINSAKNLVDTYSIIIKSDTVLEQVIANLGIQLSYEQLSQKVTVEAVNSTQVMSISVTDPNPESARRIAEEITKVAPDIILDSVEAGSVKVISGARAGDSPVSPSKSRNTAIAGLLGLVLCAGLIIVRELLNNTIKSDADIQKKLGLNVLGVIPLVTMPGDKKGDRKKKRKKGESSHRLITVSAKGTPFNFVESYKSLRTNLNFLAVSSECKTIIVTSSVAEEGKSGLSINLATSLAESGKHVILLDCDLRKPIIHRYLHLNNKRSQGLTGVLSGTVSLGDAVITSNEFGIHVLPAGAIPPNPAELLGSNKMRTLVQKLSEVYDYVIIDTPPVSVVTDAAVVGSYADGALLVVRQGFANVEAVQLAKRNLESTSVHILGAVLNEFDAAVSGRSGGYAYSYYYYSDYSNKDNAESATAE